MISTVLESSCYCGSSRKKITLIICSSLDAPRRNRLGQFLKENGIQTLIHYPIAAHHQECYKRISCDPRGLPNAGAHAEQCLSLPCHPQLRDDEVSKIITAVNEFA